MVDARKKKARASASSVATTRRTRSGTRSRSGANTKRTRTKTKRKPTREARAKAFQTRGQSRKYDDNDEDDEDEDRRAFETWRSGRENHEIIAPDKILRPLPLLNRGGGENTAGGPKRHEREGRNEGSGGGVGERGFRRDENIDLERNHQQHQQPPALHGPKVENTDEEGEEEDFDDDQYDQENEVKKKAVVADMGGHLNDAQHAWLSTQLDTLNRNLYGVPHLLLFVVLVWAGVALLGEMIDYALPNLSRQNKKSTDSTKSGGQGGGENNDESTAIPRFTMLEVFLGGLLIVLLSLLVPTVLSNLKIAKNDAEIEERSLDVVEHWKRYYIKNLQVPGHVEGDRKGSYQVENFETMDMHLKAMLANNGMLRWENGDKSKFNKYFMQMPQKIWKGLGEGMMSPSRWGVSAAFFAAPSLFFSNYFW